MRRPTPHETHDHRLSRRPAATDAAVARAVHVVAALELLKGLAALALAFGFAALQRYGLERLAIALVGYLHLSSVSHWPALIVGWSAHLQEVHPGQVEGVALVYALMRAVEGGGLWLDRRWAAWFSLISTGIYLPFELFHFWHRPGGLAALIFLFNLGILILMALRLHLHRASPH